MANFVTWKMLDETQRNSCLGAVNELVAGTRAVAFVGKAGTGKSSCMSHVVNLLGSHGLMCHIMAPTNKAALVLKNKGIKDAKTVHSAIYMPSFDQVMADAVLELMSVAANTSELNDAEKQCPKAFMISEDEESNVLEAFRYVRNTLQAGETIDEETVFSILRVNAWDFFLGWGRREELYDRTIAIVDESSMLTAEMLSDLLDLYTGVLMVGDNFQLPPVNGIGALTQADRTFSLEHVFRSDGNIVAFANSLRVE